MLNETVEQNDNEAPSDISYEIRLSPTQLDLLKMKSDPEIISRYKITLTPDISFKKGGAKITQHVNGTFNIIYSLNDGSDGAISAAIDLVSKGYISFTKHKKCVYRCFGLCKCIENKCSRYTINGITGDCMENVLFIRNARM